MQPATWPLTEQLPPHVPAMRLPAITATPPPLCSNAWTELCCTFAGDSVHQRERDAWH